MTAIPVDPRDATERQLLVRLNDLTEILIARSIALEATVSELTTAVTDLQTAVAGVAARVGGFVAALNTANADAAQAHADLQAALANDQTDAAAIAALQQQLADAISAQSVAASDIETQVSALNQVAAPTP